MGDETPTEGAGPSECYRWFGRVGRFAPNTLLALAVCGLLLSACGSATPATPSGSLLTVTHAPIAQPPSSDPSPSAVPSPTLSAEPSASAALVSADLATLIPAMIGGKPLEVAAYSASDLQSFPGGTIADLVAATNADRARVTAAIGTVKSTGSLKYAPSIVLIRLAGVTESPETIQAAFNFLVPRDNKFGQTLKETQMGGKAVTVITGGPRGDVTYFRFAGDVLEVVNWVDRTAVNDAFAALP